MEELKQVGMGGGGTGKQSNSVSSGFVVRMFTAAFLLTVVTLFGLIWHTWRSYEQFKSGQMRNFRTVQLNGVIVHLDEVLTMSARMSSESGDSKWEDRYRVFEPQLDAAIHEAMELWPNVFISEAVSQTNLANIKLVDMENRAFDFVRAGDDDAAQEILYSDAYEEQKRIYSDGMEQVTTSMNEHVLTEIARQRGNALTTVTFLVILVILTMGVWIYSMYILNRYINKKASV
jgi:CHASE3 domain sensor protein